MGMFEGGGGRGGGLTWPLILRIFGMVSITFFFAPPLGGVRNFFLALVSFLTYVQYSPEPFYDRFDHRFGRSSK